MLSPNGFECIQCGSRVGTLRFADCEDYYLKKPYRADYYRCEDCELTQQAPVPSDVAAFYDAYPIHEQKSVLHRVMRAIVMRPSYFKIGRFMRGWRSGTPPVIIDFGCGDGWFLKECAAFDTTRVGYELDPTIAAHVAGELGVPVFCTEDAIIRDFGGKADLATMHFVVEHVTDLNRTFAVIAKLLKPGGVFHFVVPNIGSWEARLFGKKWHNLDCPRHISFPEVRAVRQLAGRWGFSLAEARGVPFPNGIAGSIPVILTGSFRFPLFLASLPLGILLSRLFPSGNMAYRLVRS